MQGESEMSEMQEMNGLRTVNECEDRKGGDAMDKSEGECNNENDRNVRGQMDTTHATKE